MAYTEASYRATQKYKAKNIKRISLEVSKATYDEIKAYTVTKGETINGFIKRAIAEAMEHDKSTTNDIQSNEKAPGQN